MLVHIAQLCPHEKIHTEEDLTSTAKIVKKFREGFTNLWD